MVSSFFLSPRYISFKSKTSEEALTEHVMQCSARRQVSADGTTATTTTTPQLASSAQKHRLVIDYVDVPRKKKITKKISGLKKGSKVQSSEYDRKEAVAMSTSDTSTGGRTTSPCTRMSVGEGDVAAGLKSVVGFAAGSKMGRAASERYESGEEAEQGPGHDLRQIDAHYECPVCLKLFSRAITPLDEIQSHVVQCTDLNETVGDDDDAKLSAEIAAMAATATPRSKVIARKEKGSGTEEKGKVATKRRSKPSKTKAASKAHTKKKGSYRRLHKGYGGTANVSTERLNRARDIQSLASGGPHFALKTMVLSELDSFY